MNGRPADFCFLSPPTSITLPKARKQKSDCLGTGNVIEDKVIVSRGQKMQKSSLNQRYGRELWNLKPFLDFWG
jgi:hypothetical protein